MFSKTAYVRCPYSGVSSKRGSTVCSELLHHIWVLTPFTLFVILQGIGTSGQGAANGILFCLFTQIVRHKLLNAAKCVYCRNRCSNKGSYLLESETGLESDERDREEDGPTIFEDSVKSHARPLLNVSSGNGAHGYSAMGHTQ